MPLARITSNTSKEYPCTVCGSAGNIVREGDNPRLKCNSCGFMYDGKDSQELLARGEIPEGPPTLLDPIEEEVEDVSYLTGSVNSNTNNHRRLPLAIALPRSPSYVLLAKDRKDFEFVTKRTLKKEVLKWIAADKPHDLFELILKKVDAKVEIE